MRSRAGVLAAIVFLLALPLAILYQLFFNNGVEILIHGVFGLGFALSACAVFDFKTSKWITWLGCAATSALAAIFLLQGLSLIIQNDTLTYLAFQVLGQQLEFWLVDLFILWFVALLLMDSQGKTRVFGFVVMSLVVCLEVYKYTLSFLGATPAESLKIGYLLVFVWFLLESKKKE